MKRKQYYLKSLIDSKYCIPIIWIIGLAFSVVTSGFYYQLESKKIEIKFKNEVNQFASSLHREFELNLESLYTLATLFKSNEEPGYQRFIEESKSIRKRNPGFLALEWIPWVKHEMRSFYEKKHQQEFPGFKFIEKNSTNNLVNARFREEYFPVYYVDPYIKNKNAFGYDLASEKKRYNTLKSSQLLGEPLISDNIKLVQEKTNPEGCLAFLPIFDKKKQKKKHNPESLKGYVLGVFKFSKIFEAAHNTNFSQEIQIQLFNKKEETSNDILFTYQPIQINKYKDVVHQFDLPLLWGKEWKLIAHPTNKYVKRERSFYPQLILIAGIIFTSLIALLFYSFSKRNTQLTQLNIMKSKFLSLISHDVRGGIGTMDVLLKLVLEDFEGYNKNQLKEVITSIEQNTNSIHLTLENLISWSKNELLALKPKKSLFDITELFDNINEYFKPLILLKNLKFSIHYGTKNTYIHADKNMILASLRNIISNAIKYTQKGGEIQIRLLQHKTKHHIEIEDTGMGMDSIELQKLFEYNITHKKRGTNGESSTGIGLMITKDFLDMNNAKVQVESHLGKGTIFKIQI
ncbi:CHASE domain-containing sensor histidine kinase [Aquimarina sediminis]|uniref:CHASE domain-containing sensor histidine kinase n=1 Tax=Aquimarina sediminis TaxID=2070536 RepID=UPI000CA02CF9|nr:CHASE domain-containing protein [Aquimarina sediminis]